MTTLRQFIHNYRGSFDEELCLIIWNADDVNRLAYDLWGHELSSTQAAAVLAWMNKEQSPESRLQGRCHLLPGLRPRRRVLPGDHRAGTQHRRLARHRAAAGQRHQSGSEHVAFRASYRLEHAQGCRADDWTRPAHIGLPQTVTPQPAPPGATWGPIPLAPRPQPSP